MIQRKQTLFLLAVVLIGFIMLFVPFISYNRTGAYFNLAMISAINSAEITSDIYYPFIINAFVIILATIIIFLFKNRVLQYKLVNLLAFLNIFVIGSFFLLDFFTIAVENVSFTFGAFLPVISAVLAYFAGHFIKKDEEMVRNADRIR